MAESKEIASVRNFDIGTKRQLALAPALFREFTSDISSWYVKIANYLAIVGEGSVTHTLFDRSGTVTWKKDDLLNLLKELQQKTPTMLTEQYKLGTTQPRSEGVKKLQEEITQIYRTEVNDEERLKKTEPLVDKFRDDYIAKKEEKAANNTNGITAPRLVTDENAVLFIYHMLQYILTTYGYFPQGTSQDAINNKLAATLPVFSRPITITPYDGAAPVTGRFMDANTLRTILNDYLSIVKYGDAVERQGGPLNVNEDFVNKLPLNTASIYSTSIDPAAQAEFGQDFVNWKINPTFLARNSNTLAGTLLKNISYQLPKDTKFTVEMQNAIRKAVNDIKVEDYQLVKDAIYDSKRPEIAGYLAYDVINSELGNTQIELVAKYIQKQRQSASLTSLNSKAARELAKAYKVMEIYYQLSPENQALVDQQSAYVRAGSKDKVLIDSLFVKSFNAAQDTLDKDWARATANALPQDASFSTMLATELTSDASAADDARKRVLRVYNKFKTASDKARANNQLLSRKIGVKESKRQTKAVSGQGKRRNITGVSTD